MKLSLTIVLLLMASYAFTQSSDKDSRSTKIDETEKKRIENQYKALNNFYIDDDGLVVYQTQSRNNQQGVNEVSTDTINQTSPKEVTKETEGKLLTEESKHSNNLVEKKPISRNTTPSEERINSKHLASQDKSPVRPNIIKKEASKPTEARISEIPADKEPTEDNSRTIINSPITEQEEDNKLATNTPKKNNEKANQTSKSKGKKTSIFDKKQYSPQYKTMEEAALAVEALLEDLRKEQVQTTGAGSMSSRLAGGAGRGTLRKKPSTNPSYSSNNTNSENSSSRNTNSSTFIDEESAFGYEPSYFINGNEVEKSEVNRLRKKQIINKEVRTRNTVTGNPNGEVWYEVKYDN